MEKENVNVKKLDTFLFEERLENVSSLLEITYNVVTDDLENDLISKLTVLLDCARQKLNEAISIFSNANSYIE